ncbi:MAG: DUF998 domain-containing protein [Promethearchaeota archaeon]|nr:MAG: DUF998 domain-containing protein [Candidatus Lokiarchaeota archaeon]
MKNRTLKKFIVAYNWLTNPNIVKKSVTLNLILFLPGLFLCVMIAMFLGPQGYTIWDNFISDLGSFNYTPIPFLFDLILMIGSLLIIPAFLYNFKYLTKDTRPIVFNSQERSLRRVFHIIIYLNALLGLIFLFVGAVGMFGIGIFSEDRTTQFHLHFYFSVLVFVGLIFGAMFVGIANLLNKVICPRYLGAYMIFGPFITGYLYLNPPFMLTDQFLEWLMLFSFQVWLIPAAFFTLNQIRKGSNFAKI